MAARSSPGEDTLKGKGMDERSLPLGDEGWAEPLNTTKLVSLLGSGTASHTLSQGQTLGICLVP